MTYPGFSRGKRRRSPASTTLSAGDGIKRVWVQYESNALLQGGVYVDTIELPEPGSTLSVASGLMWLGCLNRLRRRQSNGSC